MKVKEIHDLIIQGKILKLSRKDSQKSIVLRKHPTLEECVIVELQTGLDDMFINLNNSQELGEDVEVTIIQH